MWRRVHLFIIGKSRQKLEIVLAHGFFSLFCFVFFFSRPKGFVRSGHFSSLIKHFVP